MNVSTQQAWALNMLLGPGQEASLDLLPEQTVVLWFARHNGNVVFYATPTRTQQLPSGELLQALVLNGKPAFSVRNDGPAPTPVMLFGMLLTVEAVH